MKSVVFCGSMKHAAEMVSWGEKLKSMDVKVYVPEDFSDSEVWTTGTLEEKIALAHELTVDHFEKIKEYDVVFIFNKDGYAGNSTTLEIGCAAGLNKPIYALSESDEELCRLALYQGYADTPEKLVGYLK
tara:strand:- start:140 stop:529 length:390 start_codon:yes stop_codon:yes gene_type:complete